MERYGTIPKRFTKEWWSYFWYYYKWRVISILFALLVIAYTCAQCAFRTNYDATISYVGDKYYYDQNINEVCSALSNVIDDVDKNGENNVLFQQITLAKNGTSQANTEYESGMRTKLTVEFQAGDTYLFLFSKQELDRLLERESSEQIFVKIDDWVENKDIPPEKIIKKDGQPCAINLINNKFMADYNFQSEDLYLAVRCMRSRDMNNKKEIASYNNAIKIANYILNYQG